MRVFKFLAGGVIALFVLSAILKALFFLAFGTVIIGGIAFIGRAIAHKFMGHELSGDRREAWRTFMQNAKQGGDFQSAFDRPFTQTRQYQTIEII